MTLRTLQDLELNAKRVLLRADFNVPLRDGVIKDDSRIQATLPTLRYVLEHGASIIAMSHLGRPKGVDASARLAPVAARLSELLGQEVRYQQADGPAAEGVADFVAAAPAGSLTLLENLRFDPRETKNAPELCQALASYADVYVNDAFGAAHRAHASTEGVAKLLPSAAGLLLEREVRVLSKLLESPEKPFKVILGGAKVSDKIGVIRNLLEVVDEILIGGAMSYTFSKALGGSIGKSLVENEHLQEASSILQAAKAKGVTLHLPSDSTCATAIEAGVEARVFPADDVPADYMGLDIGPDTLEHYQHILKDAKTVLWNGPLGVFEISPFDTGTRAIAQTVAALDAYTVIGGGDSVSAVNATGLADKISHISTGGGASLELLEGKTLPGVAALTS